MKKIHLFILLIFFPTFLLAEIKNSPFYHYLKGLFHFYNSELTISENELLTALNECEDSYIFSSLSELYLHKLDFEKAEKMAESALKLDPSNVNALLILGNIYLNYLREGKDNEYLKKAEEIYKTIISLDPNYPDPYYILGKWIYLPSSRWKEAEEVLKKYSEISPDGETYILLGEISKRTGNDRKAEEYYRKAIEVNPSSYLAYSYLSDFYNEKGEILKEIEICKSAIEKFPYNYFFYHRLAEVLLEKKDFKEALNQINKALEISPSNPQILMTKAKILLNLKKYEEFLKTLQEIFNIEPEMMEAKIYLFEYYMQIYEYRKALEVLMEIGRKEIAPIQKKETYKTIGYLYTLMKDYKSAKSYLEKSLEMGKDDPDIYSYLSFVYKELKDYSSALKIAEEGLRINASSKSLILNKIYALSGEGNIDSALRLIEKEFERTKDDDFLFAGLNIFIEKKEWKKGEEYIKKIWKKSIKNEEFYLRIGDFYEKMGNFAKAEKALKKAISINSSYGNALNYIAYSWALRDKNLRKALLFAIKAVNLDPENPDYLDTLGWVYFKLGQIAEAKKFLEKAYSKKPWEPEIVEHIGLLRIKEGKIQEGIELLQNSIEIGSERKETIEKFIKEAKKKLERSIH